VPARWPKRIAGFARRARIALPGQPGPGGRGRRRGLTARELAVLMLAAAGRSTCEIPAELFILVKTASVHVSSITASAAPPAAAGWPASPAFFSAHAVVEIGREHLASGSRPAYGFAINLAVNGGRNGEA
jgi:Bacterial regulatory proteins, luxR family